MRFGTPTLQVTRPLPNRRPRLREALNQVKSGTIVLRSLAEGKPPRGIALDWFKREMNLATDGLAHKKAGPLGLSWFHLITMTLVTTFAAAMLAIYLLRMRRANALIDRLTDIPAVPVAAVAAPSRRGRGTTSVFPKRCRQ